MSKSIPIKGQGGYARKVLDTAVERDRLSTANVDLLDLLEDLVDEDDCHYDHHGYCQAHGWMATEPICPHKRARAVLAKAKEPGS